MFAVGFMHRHPGACIFGGARLRRAVEEYAPCGSRGRSPHQVHGRNAWLREDGSSPNSNLEPRTLNLEPMFDVQCSLFDSCTVTRVHAPLVRRGSDEPWRSMHLAARGDARPTRFMAAMRG